MSNHFTYEIDERNLRIQLKEFVLPVKEGAWEKFETFSDSMINHQRESRFKGINLNLNRNVVLPSVFGVVIILFSFLLVNFVSIKNPVKESAKKQEIQAASQVQPQVEIKEIKKPEPQVVKAAAPIANIAAAEVPSEQNAENIPVANNTNPVSQEVTTETTPQDLADSVAKEEAKAKRRAKRRAEAVEAQQLNEIRPTLVSEERDAEIRPE